MKCETKGGNYGSSRGMRKKNQKGGKGKTLSSGDQKGCCTELIGGELRIMRSS